MRWAAPVAMLSLAALAQAQQGGGRPGRALIGVALLVVIAAMAWAASRREGRGDRPRPGRLPGDIRVERPGCVVYVPLTTALLASLALSLVLGGAGWLLGAASFLFGWVGSLPGDLHFGGQGVRVVVPITSALVLSALVTTLVNLVLWLRRRHRDERGPDGRGPRGRP